MSEQADALEGLVAQFRLKPQTNDYYSGNYPSLNNILPALDFDFEFSGNYHNL